MRRRVGWRLGIAVSAMFMGGTVVVASGVAEAGTARSVVSHDTARLAPSKKAGPPSLVGVYNWFLDDSSPVAVTLNADGSWISSNTCAAGGSATDGGSWSTLDKVVALSDTDCREEFGGTFVAKVGKVGKSPALGSAKKPGSYNIPYYVSGSWYATPASSGAARSSASRVQTRPLHGATSFAPSLVGEYNWFVNSSSVGSLDLNSDGTWNTDSCDGGSWLSLDKVIVLSDSSCGGGLYSEGATFLAKVGKGPAFGSATSPGPYLAPTSGSDGNYGYSGTWYATP